MRIIRIVVAVALLLTFSVVPALAEAGVEEVSQQIMCQCGCTMVLNTCECGTAEQMRGEIKGMLGEGKTPAQVINYYVGKYGEKVLSAPAKQGFNWSAYITPFVVILLAAAGVVLILRQWVFRSRNLVPPPQPALATAQAATMTGPDLDALRARLRQELESYGD